MKKYNYENEWKNILMVQLYINKNICLLPFAKIIYFQVKQILKIFFETFL